MKQATQQATAAEMIGRCEGLGSEADRKILSWFFKTGPGQYGEGDRFLGIRVPATRTLVREYRGRLPMDEIGLLIASEWHEVRLAGFLLLVAEMEAAVARPRGAGKFARQSAETPAVSARRRKEIVDFYLANARQANNWDLVDLSCPYILGAYLLAPGPDGQLPPRDILDRLAASTNLWEQRISIVATLALIRAGQFDDTLRIAETLLPHSHDLIHKATGWMLREVGKRDTGVLTAFLRAHYASIPRTTLRYAIEKFPAPVRKAWLAGPVVD